MDQTRAGLDGRISTFLVATDSLKHHDAVTAAARDPSRRMPHSQAHGTDVPHQIGAGRLRAEKGDRRAGLWGDETPQTCRRSAPART